MKGGGAIAMNVGDGGACPSPRDIDGNPADEEPPQAHKMMNGNISSSLQRDVQAAFDWYLAAQERSMADFMSSVARFCENEEDRFAAGKVLRGLSWEVVREGTHCDIDRGLHAQGVLDSKLKSVSNIAISLPRVPATPSPAARMQLEELAASPHSDITTPEDVRADFLVPPLDFIDDSGEMIKKPSKIVQLLGPLTQQYLADGQSFLETRWKPMPLKGIWSRAVRSNYFQLLGSAVILSNFFFIIAQSDYKMANLNQDDTDAMVAVGYALTGYYLLELIANLTVLRAEFFVGSDAGWNIFDMVIVIVAVCETVAKWAGIEGMNTSFLRIIRFLKMSRVLRMFSAMRAFKEIKLIVEALTGCFTLFFFSSILLGIFLSVVAIFLVQGMASYLETGPDIDADYLSLIHDRFGSITYAMLTLYKCLSGGFDWGPIYDMVNLSGTAYGNLFLLFINFSLLAFLNVVVGVFCEKAMNLASVPTTEELLSQRGRQQEGDAVDLLALLHLFQAGNGPMIRKRTFNEFIGHPHVISYFEVRGVKPSSIRRIFNVLCDISDSECVDVRSFVSTIVKLDGLPSALDLHALSCRQIHAQHVQKLHNNAKHDELIAHLKASAPRKH